MNRLMFKVLIADDEYWIRENLRGILDWQAHSFVFIEPAVDGEQALEVIRQQHPDIVITDVNMPFMSGTELIERVGTEMPEIVFIALSGYSDYEFVRAALVAGAVDYLLKPISKGDLLKVLSKAVDRILESRARKIELQTVQENLRIASSSALDRELSQLIYRTSDKKLHTQVQARLTSGYLAPFDESYCNFIRDEALDSVTVDGKVYGLPYNALYQGVYYNRELFNAHNVKVPENLAELQTAIDTFNANNIMPFATHMVDTWSIGNITMQFAVNDVFRKTPDWGDQFRASKVHYVDSPEFTKCYEYNKLIYDNTWKDQTFSMEQTACDAKMVMGDPVMTAIRDAGARLVRGEYFTRF